MAPSPFLACPHSAHQQEPSHANFFENTASLSCKDNPQIQMNLQQHLLWNKTKMEDVCACEVLLYKYIYIYISTRTYTTQALFTGTFKHRVLPDQLAHKTWHFLIGTNYEQKPNSCTRDPYTTGF